MDAFLQLIRISYGYTKLKKEVPHESTTRKSFTQPRRVLRISRYRQNQGKRITERPIKHVYFQDWQPLLRQQEEVGSMA